MRKSLTVVYALLAGLAATFSAGCSGASSDAGTDVVDSVPAPSPTANPSAHIPATFKVTSQAGFVDAVKATGEWYISNHTCAPVQKISGARIERIVHTPASIRQEGGSFIVTVLSDQFDQGDCHWLFMGIAVELFRDGKPVGSAGANKALIEKYDGRLQVICNSNPGVASCVYPEAAKRTFLRLPPHPGIFSFTIEEV